MFEKSPLVYSLANVYKTHFRGVQVEITLGGPTFQNKKIKSAPPSLFLDIIHNAEYSK